MEGNSDGTENQSTNNNGDARKHMTDLRTGHHSPRTTAEAISSAGLTLVNILASDRSRRMLNGAKAIPVPSAASRHFRTSHHSQWAILERQADQHSVLHRRSVTDFHSGRGRVQDLDRGRDLSSDVVRTPGLRISGLQVTIFQCNMGTVRARRHWPACCFMSSIRTMTVNCHLPNFRGWLRRSNNRMDNRHASPSAIVLRRRDCYGHIPPCMVSRINVTVAHQPTVTDSQTRIAQLPIDVMARPSEVTGLMPIDLRWIDLRWIDLKLVGWNVIVRTMRDQMRNVNARTIESDQMPVDRNRNDPIRTDLIPSAAVSDHFPLRAPIEPGVRHCHCAVIGHNRPKTDVLKMLMIVSTVNAPKQRSQRLPPL
jgi:hypothetical protein